MGRVFACSDLHGQLDLWNQIKTFLQQDDKLYFLGDAIDRGQDGFLIMRELLSDNRVVYIKGNHEDMMAKALREIKDNGGAWGGAAFELWTWNGCYSTIDSWVENGSRYDWIKVLENLPIEATYINSEGRQICLCHAGFTPGAKPLVINDFLWNRDHIGEEISEDYLDGDYVIVHGHTPTIEIIDRLDNLNKAASICNKPNKPHWEYQERNGIIVYDEGVKIGIDCGSAFTNHIALLNLDTFETVPFDGND